MKSLRPIPIFLTWMLFGLSGSFLNAQINLIREEYGQGFDVLIQSGNLALQSTGEAGKIVQVPLLPGWFLAKTGGSGTTDMTLNADDGTLNGGRVYSYGSIDSVDRALGLKGSGTHAAAVGAAFVNRLDATIPSVTITYVHELWSVQGTTGENASEDRVLFSYGFSSDGITQDNFLTSDAMRPYSLLDAVSPASRGLTGVTDGSDPVRARDGNAEEWKEEISAALTNLGWANGDTLFIRWQDTDSSGFDAGHGIDDFSLQAGGNGLGQRTRLPHLGVKVDGDFSDWKRGADLYQDTVGDVTIPSGIDFVTLGGVLSTDGLSLYIKTANPTVLSNSSLRIYLDVDGDADTGSAFAGLGAELMLDFSAPPSDQRFFPVDTVFYPEAEVLPAAEVIVDFFPNGLNAYTTHPEAEEFEILIPLSSLRQLEPGGRLGILLRDGVRDFAPNLGETFHIDVPYGIPVEGKLETLDKPASNEIRMAAYNVLVNGPFDPEKEAAFGRQLAAARPDIINFQELYLASPTWAEEFVNRWVPLEEGQWQAKKNNDCITVSRFPIKNTWYVNANLIVQVDTQAIWGVDSVIVNAHTPAHVENQSPRINETTNIMLLLRRLMNGTEPNAPEEEFTVFFIGDLNANSPKIELSSPRTGEFFNPSYASLDYWPDAYNLPLVDAAPRHTHTDLPRLFTWRSLESGNSQRLDYIFYQQSHLTKTRAFVFDTGSMPAEFLTEHGLEAADSSASDHFLLFADFRKREVDIAWEAQDVSLPAWFHSRWIGWISQYSANDYFSPLHGYLYGVTRQEGVWLWDQQLGWWFTHASMYPYAYLQASGSWIYFYPSPEPPRWYFDFLSGEWKS